jgi:hypothetical protein
MTIVLGFALILAITDMILMGTMKKITTGVLSNYWMIFVSLFYAVQPWIFLKGLQFSSMTVLNLSWDLMSDILVTMAGLFYFREYITSLRIFGIIFSFLAIILFSIDKYKTPNKL